MEKPRFDIGRLKGKPARLRDKLRKFKIPLRLLVLIPGIFSTIWFLLRVIPKPSRATYPCMRVAAPFMSGLVTYLLAVFGLTIISRRSKRKILNARYSSALILLFFMAVLAAFNPSANTISTVQEEVTRTGPDDGPNQPFGVASGVMPGRVVWNLDTMATERNLQGYYFSPENMHGEVVSRMLDRSVTELTGKSNVRESWDAMFRYFNMKKHNEARSYKPGEKIFIKINQTSGRGRLRESQREKGDFYYPQNRGDDDDPDPGTCETSPYIVLQILRQLVNECGVNQSDIAVGDPQNPVYGHNYDIWQAEFPGVLVTDRTTGNFGRTLIHPTRNDLLFYSDKFQKDKLYDIIENASYMINVANLKPHSGTGITLTAKNHFGSQSRAGAYHLHYSHLCQIEGKPPTNAGYHKYRVLVDLMGSSYLGRNTILYVIDGLFAGGASEGGPPVKYYMAPFNGDWANSVFISQDQVALESVCYDFLRTEWNGTYVHDRSNNFYEAMPAINGVDDYLHQAADSSNWPKGIIYDPDNSGRPIPSLGVHEHWNNPVNKQYSRNLGKDYGIELVSIPSGLTGPGAPAMVSQVLPARSQKKQAGKSSQSMAVQPPAPLHAPVINSVINRKLPDRFKGRKFLAAALDDDNTKWFLTDKGIVRGGLFGIHDQLRLLDINGIKGDSLKDFVYELSDNGPGFWIAGPEGIIRAGYPEDSVFLNLKDYQEPGRNIISVAAGSQLKWFGSQKGISALYHDKWLTPDYQEMYPDELFSYYPVTDMATSKGGDSVYVATIGGGVSRFYRNSNVDAISGASQYMQWGPILMPSDSVYSLCITRNGTQWIGTNRGVARHTGSNTLENWTVFDTSTGLVNDFVQAIAAEPYGKNVWVGTKGGISVFDGIGWRSFTEKDGLISNNILFLMADKNGLVYIGTDKGIMVYAEGYLVCYY